MTGLGVREIAAAVNVLARGRLARYGGHTHSDVRGFEADLERFLGVEHALAVNSGTSALMCALVGAGIGPGDEVLVPAYTWVATAAAALAVGAVPVLVDIDESLTMDPTDMKRKLSPDTRAVIPVHMLNLVCDMDPIMVTAREAGLFVLEDACQAIGATYRNQRVGSIGDAAAFSFNQHKNIKSGEGGAVVTNDERCYVRARMYHDVGSYMRDDRADRDEVPFAGLNLRMPELSAAILRPQLRRLDRQMERRRARRRAIVEAIGGRDAFRISPHHEPDLAAGLTIVFDDADAAAAAARLRGINRLSDTGRHVYTNWESVLSKHAHHPALNPHVWAPRNVNYRKADCPATIDILSRTCSVSLDPQIPTPVLVHYARRLPR